MFAFPAIINQSSLPRVVNISYCPFDTSGYGQVILDASYCPFDTSGYGHLILDASYCPQLFENTNP